MTKSMDDLLRETLDGRGAAPPPTPCLDAETAAAFADDALTARERAAVETHVADCARCQSLLAALVRTMPPGAARAWWRRPAIAWLVPAAVAATAVIIWVRVPDESVAPAMQVAREQTETPQTAPKPVGPNLQSRVAADPQPPAAAEVQSQAARSSAALRRDAAQRLAKQERDRIVTTNTAPAAAPAGSLADRRVEVPPSAAPALDASAQEKPALKEAVASESVAVTVSAEAPPPAAGARALRSEARITDASRLEIARDRVIVSSNAFSRWRIGSGGVVQHSSDGGATWATQSTGTDATPTAGSSPSPFVCWLVGPAGLVLITTDEGRSWQRVPFPEAVNLTSVRATDGYAALVLASDGRSFTTTDRGKTWIR